MTTRKKADSEPQQTETPISFEERMAAVLQDVGKVQRDSQNKYAKYSYASADAVFAHVRPVLARHKLPLAFEIGDLKTITHRKAEFLILPVSVWFEGEKSETVATFPVPLNTAGTKGVRLDPQAMQSAVTFALKYFLRTRLLLDTGDRDADQDDKQEVEPPSEAPEPDAQISIDANGMFDLHGGTREDWEMNPTRERQINLFKACQKHLKAHSGDESELFVLTHCDFLMAVLPQKGRAQLGRLVQIGENLTEQKHAEFVGD